VKPKELIWVGQSKKALVELPNEVQRTIGYGLYIAQCGEMPKDAKPLKGFGSAGVLEIIDSDEAGTYRAVYTVKLADTVFVLHVFQKKSKHGIKTPQADIELIKTRLKMAEDIHKERSKNEKK
jgi:phage-related protein